MRSTIFGFIVGVGLVLLSLPFSAGATPKDRSAECIPKLRAIYKALQDYQRNYHKLPDQLSDLIPTYLPDKEALHCPDDDNSGFLGDRAAHQDPRVACSYSYEMSADTAAGAAIYPGPPPQGNQGWGTCRQFSTWLQKFYGDAVPMLRCYNHRRFSDPKAHDDVLNLTEKGVVYRSGMLWEASETGCLELASCMERDLDKGVAFFEPNWYLGGIDSRIGSNLTTSIWAGMTFSPSVRRRLRTFVQTLEKNAPRLRAASYAYRIAARFAEAAQDRPKALRLANQSLAAETGQKSANTHEY
jgi:hypothetical protein